jgi:hypothetical protein
VECDERLISVLVDISGHYLIVLCIQSVFQIVIKTDSADNSLEVEPNYYVCQGLENSRHRGMMALKRILDGNPFVVSE